MSKETATIQHTKQLFRTTKRKQRNNYNEETQSDNLKKSQIAKNSADWHQVHLNEMTCSIVDAT